jgi:ATP-binding cassette subfamily C protein LapB
MDTTSLLQSDNIDPLLACLVAIAKHHQRPYSAHALRAGLAIGNEALTPSLFVQAAENAGMVARIVKRPLKQISSLVLPVVLLLQNNQACILYKYNPDNSVELGMPEIPQKITQPQTELEAIYTGYAIFVHPVKGTAETGVFDIAERDEDQSMSAWFWGTLWHYRKSYANVILAALVINLFTMIAPLYVMNVYDRVVPYSAFVTLWVLSIGVFIIYIFDFLLRMLRSYVIDVVGKKADVLLASSLFRKVLNLQLEHKPQSVGSFVKNLGEFDTIRDFFTSLTLNTLIDLPFAILFLLLIWYLAGILVWVPILCIPVIFLVSVLVEVPLREKAAEMAHSAARKHAVLVETVTALEVIKTLVAEGVQQRKWEQEVSNNSRLGLSSRFLSSIVVNTSYTVQQIAYCITVIVGVYLVAAGHLTLGGLIACSILTSRALAPLVQVTNLLMRINQVRLALDGLNKFMKQPSERPPGKRFLQRDSIQGEIEFSSVTFQYPEQKNKALENISFKIAAGERVGLLGRMGSGKTSLQKIMLGLYHPQDGTVYLDGVDLTQLDPVDLRRNIGYVPQDSLLFAGTIRENILMGRPGADDEQILHVAKLAGVDNFVKHHPESYDWVIGERGEGLSGGQRQAIATARALLSNAPIILMDEPTSAADDKSEHDLIVNLEEFIQNKTFIITTHRLTMLQLVTRVIALHDGRIVIDGPRDEVLKRLSAAPVAPPQR